MRNFVIAGMLVAPLWAGFAQAPAAAKTPANTPATTTHTPESLECSKQADAKGLHGKERKTFRSTCKQELKKKS